MGITRQIIFAIDPYRGTAVSKAFASVADANNASKAFTCGVVPPTRGSGTTIMQEAIFLGTTAGAGKTMMSFRDTLAMDGSSAVTGRWISQRLDPDARTDIDARIYVTTKRFQSIQFAGPSPLSQGLTLQWCKDQDPASDALVTWYDFNGGIDDEVLFFESCIAKWIHLKLEDATNTVNTVVLPRFALQYYSIPEGREGTDR